MIQLILHLIGDYLTQSDWMAQGKTKSFWPAFCHALAYSLPFLLIGSPLAVLVIFVTHFFIDRYRLARFVVWLKNVLLDPEFWCGFCVWFFDPYYRTLWHKKLDWSNCSVTGYPSELPVWLAVWLMIVADNTLHLAINAAAIAWL